MTGQWRRGAAVALMLAVLAGAGTACDSASTPAATLGTSLPAATVTSPAAATATALAGTVLPIIIVGTTYVNQQQSALLASTNLRSLLQQLKQLGLCPLVRPCFAGVAAPADALLLVVQPASSSCSEVRTISARLIDLTDLSVVLSLKACNPAPGAGALPAPADLLLAVPLANLPPRSHLTITTSAQGDERYGMARLTATVDLP